MVVLGELFSIPLIRMHCTAPMKAFVHLLSSSQSSDPPTDKIISYPYLHNVRPTAEAALVVLERALINQVACIVENRVSENDLLTAIESYSKTLGDTTEIDDTRVKIVGLYLECVTKKSHNRLKELSFVVKPSRLKCLLEAFSAPTL
jgi:hypothetical protein